jgi:hypothetical protein
MRAAATAHLTIVTPNLNGSAIGLTQRKYDTAAPSLFFPSFSLCLRVKQMAGH